VNAERLVAMANDIAAFFASEPDRTVAVAAVANHLTKFWDPRMRREIVAHYQAGSSGLSDIAAAAVAQLAQPSPAAAQTR
jgi:formate dehydrogenase subunit delta